MTFTIPAKWISSFASFLVSSDIFDHVTRIVQELEDKSLSSKDRNKAIKAELDAMGIELGSWLLRVVIQLAIAYLKTKI